MSDLPPSISDGDDQTEGQPVDPSPTDDTKEKKGLKKRRVIALCIMACIFSGAGLIYFVRLPLLIALLGIGDTEPGGSIHVVLLISPGWPNPHFMIDDPKIIAKIVEGLEELDPIPPITNLPFGGYEFQNRGVSGMTNERVKVFVGAVQIGQNFFKDKSLESILLKSALQVRKLSDFQDNEAIKSLLKGWKNSEYNPLSD